MKQYKIVENENSKTLIFDNEPEKYAIVVEKDNDEEKIILPSDNSSQNTYYIDNTKKESKLVFNPQDNIKKVITS